MSRIQVRSFRRPDTMATPPFGESAIVRIGELTVERGVLQPGWSWREHVKPIVRTKCASSITEGSCSAASWVSEWTTGKR